MMDSAFDGMNKVIRQLREEKDHAYQRGVQIGTHDVLYFCIKILNDPNGPWQYGPGWNEAMNKYSMDKDERAFLKMIVGHRKELAKIYEQYKYEEQNIMDLIDAVVRA